MDKKRIKLDIEELEERIVPGNAKVLLSILLLSVPDLSGQFTGTSFLDGKNPQFPS